MEKKAQIWIETAIYTLIGLTIIAILMSVAVPQINKIKDRNIIKQTTEALNILNDKISEIEQSPGNIRVVDFRVGKGKLDIDSANDSLIYVLENTELEISEPGQDIQEGNLILKTQEYGSRFNIILTMKYENLNFTYKGEEKTQTLQAGATPYKIQIENLGSDETSGDAKINIDFNLI